MVEYDNILQAIDRITPIQWKQLAFVQLPCMVISMHMAAMVFLGAPVDYQCEIPEQSALEKVCDQNWTETQSALFVPTNTNGQLKKCSSYDYGSYDNISCDYCWPNGTDNATLVSPSPPTTTCTSWWYDTSVFKSSVFTEFNLVCEKNYKRRLSQAIFMMGVTLGCLMWGQFSDKYGRKYAIAIPSLIGMIFAISAAFAKNFMIFTALRFFVGFCTFPPFPNTFVLGTECFAPKYRVWVAQSAQSIYALGFCLLSVLSFFIRDWRNLQLAISIPLVLLLIQYCFIHESPRWLISKMRYRAAYDIVKKIIGSKDVNRNMEVKSSELSQLEKLAHQQRTNRQRVGEMRADVNAPQYTFVDLLKTPNIRNRSLILFYLWCTVSAMYYGLTLNAADLGGNPFINLFISGFVEIPGSLMAIFILQKFGRVPTLCVTFVGGGVACTAMLFVPADMLWLNISLSMSGKLLSTAAFGAVYIYAAEVYPTPIRNVGIGTCGSWARIGGILAPFIAMLDQLATPLPYVVFGILSILAGILVLLLPETLGCNLPETIEEGENFADDDVSILSRCITKRNQLQEEDTMANFDEVLEEEKRLQGEEQSTV